MRRRFISAVCVLLAAALCAAEESGVEDQTPLEALASPQIAEASAESLEALRPYVFVWVKGAERGRRFRFEEQLTPLDYLFFAGAEPSEIVPGNVRIATLEGTILPLTPGMPLLGGERILELSTLESELSPLPEEETAGGPRLALPQSMDERRVRITGAVNSPIRVHHKPRWTLRDYLNAAGGLSAEADVNGLWILRPNGQLLRAERVSQILPGDAVLAQFKPLEEPGQGQKLPPFAEPSDKSGAPQRILVTGAVQRPGAFGFQPELTAEDYIRLAGGATENGEIERVYAARRDGTLERNPETLEPGDILIVPTMRAEQPANADQAMRERARREARMEMMNESRLTLRRFGDEFFEAGRERIRQTARRIKLLELEAAQGTAPAPDAAPGTAPSETGAVPPTQPTQPTPQPALVPETLLRNAVTGYIGPLDQLDSNALLNIPQRRIVSPGDVLRAVWWSAAGNLEPQRMRLLVSPEGEVNAPPHGRLVVVGKTLGEVEQMLRELTARETYSDTKLFVTFESLETVQAAVAGHAYLPGSYALSSAASLFNLLRICGGPNDLGSMRTIFLKRGAQTIEIDMYDFLLHGKADQEQPLRDGDLIYFAPVGRQASIQGEVGRPGIYELKEGEHYAQLFEMAGGIRPSGFAKSVQVDSARGGAERILLNLDVTGGMSNLPPLQDGDHIMIHPLLSEPVNTVQASGYLKRPGQYELKEGMRVSDLIKAARGLREGAYRARADLFRRNADGLTLTLIPVNPEDALSGGADADIPLEPFDRLTVYAETDAMDAPARTIAAQGAVKRPGNYTRADGMRVSDLLRTAGGPAPDAYRERALLLRADIQNRLAFSEPVNLLQLDKNDPILRDGDALLVLRYDEAVWEPPQSVKVTGAVQSPGWVPFTQNMRVSDALMRAGGAKAEREPTALLLRKAPSHARVESALVIDLENALSGGGEADLTLMPEDEIIVYGYGETKWRPPAEAQAIGAVQRGGSYPIQDGMCVSMLLFQAGGVMPNAYLKRADLYRYLDDYENRIAVPIELEKALAGDAEADLELRPGDAVRVWTMREAVFAPEKTTQLYGAVQRPDTYPYFEGMTLRDLIMLAGGLTPGYGKTVEIAHARQEKGSPIVRVDLEAAMAGDPAHNLVLKPGDVAAVRKSGTFQEVPRSVKITGEVAFPGSYVLEGDDRLSDIIKRAGGPTESAYLEGASMSRRPEHLLDEAQRDSIETVWEVQKLLSEQEYLRQAAKAQYEAGIQPQGIDDSLTDIASTSAGVLGGGAAPILEGAGASDWTPSVSLVTPAREIEQMFPIGRIVINLPEALGSPGGERDLLLEPNDVIHVPKLRNVIAVTGAVPANIATVYVKGLSVNDYIEVAGGAAADADMESVYVAHVNGSFTRSDQLKSLSPGDTIIVPTRVVSEKVSSGFAAAANLLRFAITTAAAAAVIIVALR